MKADPYIEYVYPDSRYSLDIAVQTYLTARSRRGERIVGLVFLGFICTFIIGIIAGLMGYAWIAVVVIPLSVLPPLSVLFLLFTPKCPCSKCQAKMKTVWAQIDSRNGREGVFLICEPCCRYAYSHKSEKP